LTTTEAIY